jgi:hypothetical protein
MNRTPVPTSILGLAQRSSQGGIEQNQAAQRVTTFQLDGTQTAFQEYTVFSPKRKPYVELSTVQLCHFAC